jgi:hypothetical protein
LLGVKARQFWLLRRYHTLKKQADFYRLLLLCLANSESRIA